MLPPARKRRSEPASRGEPLLPLTTAQPGRAPEVFLGAGVTRGAADRELSISRHVPCWSVRCGYCDSHTYTAAELGEGANRSDYAGSAIAEIALAEEAMRVAGLPRRVVSTVFVGGGTPTLLPPQDLAAMLGAVADTWGLAPGVEVTTEANPDSVTAADLNE